MLHFTPTLMYNPHVFEFSQGKMKISYIDLKKKSVSNIIIKK